MTKSVNISPDYTNATDASRQQPIQSRTALLAILVILAIAAYCSPWMSGNGAALTLTGYDLAEWSSLMPGVRYGENPMFVPGMLRLPLVILAVALALVPARRGSSLWWLCAAAALALTIAQLPPFEFFIRSDWRDDVNYGQQAALTLVSLLLVGIGLVLPRGLPRKIALGITAGVGIVAALMGTSQALALAAGYDIPLALGGGIIGYCAALICIVLTVTRQ